MPQKSRGTSHRWGAHICAFLLLLALAAPAHALEKVTLGIHWIHQAQFAGFYLAQDAGLYKKAGLEVTIVPGRPGVDPLNNLWEGKLTFATGWLSGGLELRSQGYHLVLLAQIVQRSALLLVSPAGLGIDTLADLEGRRVGFWGGHFDLLPKALFKREGLKVEVVVQNASMAPLLMGAVDAACAMRYNEYHQLYQSGINPDELNIFDFSEMGLNFPEDSIFTTEEFWKKHPEVCRLFVKASLDGWRLCMQDEPRALAAVMKRVEKSRLASNIAHQRWMLRTMIDLITHRVGPEGLGDLSEKDFNLVNKVLVDQGLMDLPVDMPRFVKPAWRAQP